MNPDFALASVTVVVTLCLAALGLRRGRTALHWVFVGAAFSVATWSFALACRDLALGSDWHTAIDRIHFFGMMAFPSFWLMLVRRLVPPASESPQRVPRLAWLMVPSGLGYLAVLTNGAHYGIVRSPGIVEIGSFAWAGPLFQLFMAWGIGCGVVAAVHLARAAARLWAPGDRSEALGLWVAGIQPPLVACLVILNLLPRGYPLIPALCGASLALLSITALRYELVAQVPLAHRDVIESLRAGVLVADRNGVLLEMNRMARQLLGVPAVRGGMSVAGLVARIAPQDSREGVATELARLEDRTRPLRLNLHEERGRRIDVWASCLRDGAGDSAGQVVVLRDRTEEIRYAEIIKRTEKLETVGTLAAGVAHEINNPLAYVRANLSELARMGETAQTRGAESKLGADLSELRDIALETLEGVARIERVVADMRRLSAAPGDGFAPLDLNELAKDAARLARLRLGPVAPIEVVLADPPPRVEGSTPLLVHAVLNLLVNALQAVETTEGPSIRVVTSREDDACVLRVIDNGPGVPEGLAAQVFEPFFSTRSEGTGLGLAVSRDLARDHGGELLCETTATGASFAIRLPALVETVP